MAADDAGTYGAGTLDVGLARSLAAGPELRAVVLVEGVSDQVALETPAAMEQLGFYICDVDLEDELIRSVGVEAVEAIIDAQGELPAFRTFQRQPAQRQRSTAQHLRRFMGTRSGRKARYAHLLVAALDLDRVPRPLDGVLKHL